MSARPVDALFDPASVAVVGASEDTRKWGNWLAQGALRGESHRPAYLVNHRAATILGRRAYRSLEELPEAPELVVIAVPGPAIAATVDAALHAGARALVVISAGAGGVQRGEHDAALAQRVRDAGAVLLGPNCLGVLDSGRRLELVPNPLPAGAIGLISQSGNLALELGLMAAPEGLGFSRFVSLGNQADLGATDLIDAFAAHDATEVIAVYIEDFRDGRAFARAAARAVQAGTPVVALAIDGSGAGSRAVQSHTGALASDGRRHRRGLCRRRGPCACARRASSSTPPRRCCAPPPPGGAGWPCSATAAAMSASPPRWRCRPASRCPSSRRRPPRPCGTTLPAAAGVSNPIDLAGAAEQDVHVFDRIARDLLGGGEVDALLVTGYFGGYAEYGPETAEQELRTAELIGGAVAATGRPAVVQTMYPHGPAAQALRRSGVPVYESVEQAAGALALLAGRGAWQPQPIPELPTADPPTPRGAPERMHATPTDGYLQARALLAAAGIRFVAHHEVTDADEAVAAALQIGYPVVLKALGQTHKSDAGGVVLNIGNEGQLRAAYAGIANALEPERCTVEQMAPLTDGIELLIGARWDLRFGPVALAGSGGLYAEILRDTAVRLAPVTEAEAEAMLRALRIAPLLTGARGRPALDLAAAATALAALSRVAAAHPELAELEINPLLVTRSEAIALDARFIDASRHETPSQERESAVHLHP